MRPMGKPKPGFEKRFNEIFEMVTKNNFPKVTFLERMKGKRVPTKKEILNEFFENQIETYETIKAPKVGRDKEASEWVMAKYNELDKKPDLDKFLKDHEGYYVIELAKEKDGVPVYASLDQDENVFRGEFLKNCKDILGEDLVNEAWKTKTASDALDYGNRLMHIADEIAKKHDLEYLKTQRDIPNVDSGSIESKIHIIYSLAKWLIFYGKNGHGYEAYF